MESLDGRLLASALAKAAAPKKRTGIISTVWLVLFTALCVCFTPVYAESGSKLSTLYLDSSDNAAYLGNYWQVWVNKSGLSSDQVIGNEDLGWKNETRDSANYSYDEREYWLRFRLQPKDLGSQEKYILELAYPLLDQIDVFELHNGEVVELYVSGDQYPFEQRPIIHKHFLFPYQAKTEASDFYLRIKTNSSIQVPMSIWTESEFWQIDKMYTYMDGVFFGGILILMLYNFFIFTSVKDRAYLYYVLYMACLLLVQAANRGVGFHLFWPDNPWFQNVIIVPSLAGVVAFASLFFMALLNLWKISRRSYYFLSVGIVFTLFSAISQFVMPYPLALKLTSIVVLTVGIGGSIVAINLWRRGMGLAAYYVAGWGAVFFSFSLYIASIFDLVPRTLVVEYATMIGILSEVMIFSFALASRINSEKKMRLTAQQTLLETQQEINKKLDVRVKQRTQELEVANFKLQEMSLSDGLTGVKNRRFFDERSQIEYKSSYREQQSLALLMIDIDHFKSINDRFGHQVGDDCLVEVANTLKECLRRPADTVSRYGGEEFAVLLPCTDLKGADLVAEKMRSSIESMRFATPQGEEVPLSISVGSVAYTPKIRDGLDNLIKRSDEQLYEAKSSGRNCVRSSDQERR